MRHALFSVTSARALAFNPLSLALVLLATAALSFVGTSRLLERRAGDVDRKLFAEVFVKGAGGISLLRKGWSAPERWGTWSEGGVAELEWTLQEPPRSDLSMWIDGRIYPFFAKPSQSIRVIVNGTYITTLERNLEGGLYGARFKIPIHVATARQPMLIAFEVANPTSPRSIDNGSDLRALGVGLTSIEIEYKS